MNRKTDLDNIIKDYKECTLDEVFVEHILDDLNDLKNFYKPVVPQFVADYIEFKKANDFHVYGAMRVIENHYDKRVPEWFYTDDNIELFARAWIDGYEVEKEKKYRVRVKGIAEAFNILNYNTVQKMYSISTSVELGVYITKFTRKELEEANFGWVFNCEGIEIEEVE